MKIKQIVSEGPISALGAVARGAGTAVGTAINTAKDAKAGFAQGYKKADKFLTPMTGRGGELRGITGAASDREQIVAKILQNQALNAMEASKLKEIKSGLQGGTIKTQQDTNLLVSAIDSALTGKPMDPRAKAAISAFAKEED